VQNWPGFKGLDKVVKSLEPIQMKYKNLSWADLIVFAGTLALNDNLLYFCPGRTDAIDGMGLQYVQPKNFLNATNSNMRFDYDLMGFNDTEVVALSARLRSAILNQANGFEGTWTSTPNVLSNYYYKTLRTETWVAYNVSTSGYTQYYAKGKSGVFMLMNDINLLNDPSYKAIVDHYSFNHFGFIKNFRHVWTKLMNIDRFAGPTGNVCSNSSILIGDI